MNYFLVKSKVQRRYWVDYDLLEEVDKKRIDLFDHSRSSFSKLDAAWQALNRGIVAGNGTQGLNPDDLGPIDLVDEYRFVRRFHSPIWFVYCYFLRLFMLKNPFA